MSAETSTLLALRTELSTSTPSLTETMLIPSSSLGVTGNVSSIVFETTGAVRFWSRVATYGVRF